MPCHAKCYKIQLLSCFLGWHNCNFTYWAKTAERQWFTVISLPLSLTCPLYPADSVEAFADLLCYCLYIITISTVFKRNKHDWNEGNLSKTVLPHLSISVYSERKEFHFVSSILRFRFPFFAISIQRHFRRTDGVGSQTCQPWFTRRLTKSTPKRTSSQRETIFSFVGNPIFDGAWCTRTGTGSHKSCLPHQFGETNISRISTTPNMRLKNRKRQKTRKQRDFRPIQSLSFRIAL